MILYSSFRFAFCSWTIGNAPWTKGIPIIKSIINIALENFMKTECMKSTHFPKYISNDYTIEDLNNIIPDQKMHPWIYDRVNYAYCKNLTELLSVSDWPIVPDVAIHYRCGDNIEAGRHGYGLLPYHTFIKYIPEDAKLIYILSDAIHPRKICKDIIAGLFKYLSKTFPDKTIVLYNGDDIFIDFYRLARANVTICSASTFCFYASLANSGKTFFPKTVLFDRKVDKYWDTFEWIDSPDQIVDIQKYYVPMDSVLFTLRGEEITAADLENKTVRMASKSKDVFYLRNKVLYPFESGRAFESMNFDWGSIYVVRYAILYLQ